MTRGPSELQPTGRDVLGGSRWFVSKVDILNTQTGEISSQHSYSHQQAKAIVGVRETTKRKRHRAKTPKPRETVTAEQAALDTRPLSETSYAVGRVRIHDALEAFNERQRQQHT